MSFIHGVGAAFKATVFLIALYLWGALFPSILCFDVIGRWLGDILFGGLLNGLNVWVLRGTLLLLSAAWITFFLRSRFFLQVRQWLKPVWLSAALLWLMPFVAALAIASEKGHERYGFPIPFMWDLMKPWPAYFGLLLPQMAIMLCVLVMAFIISKQAKRQRLNVVRLLILTAFSAFCIWSSYLSRVHFFLDPNVPMSEWEKFRYTFLPDAHYVVLWLGVCLIPSWRIIGELIGISKKVDLKA